MALCFNKIADYFCAFLRLGGTCLDESWQKTI